ncbi:MAG: hypothetical protein ACLGQH_02095 [Acidobacteriota bacterium]
MPTPVRVIQAIRPARGLRRRAVGWGVCLLLLLACSRPVEPPRRLFGLAFGDAPIAGLVRQDVPLPAELSDSLAYFAAPGRREAGWAGLVLVDPILAFYQDRLFSIDAALADPAAASGLRVRLTRDFGPPLCRDTGNRAVCLWAAGDTELVLESAGDGPGRLMVRHGPTAATLAAALPQAVGASRADGP